MPKMGNQTPIAFIEDVAHSTGIDKAVVHPVTKGKRVFERNGCLSADLVQGFEDAFSSCGIDKLVHLGTGGVRAVNRDGSFDLVGCLEVTKNIAQFAANPGVTGPARAMAMVYNEIINNAIAELAKRDQGAGDVARKMKELKDLSDTIKGIAADPASPDSITALVRLAEKLTKAGLK